VLVDQNGIAVRIDDDKTSRAFPLSILLDLGYGIGIMHQEFQSEFGPSGMDLI
jgi:hypothetical protein